MSLEENATLIKFPVIDNVKGNIGSIEGDLDVPYKIERVYYLYDIPSGALRGGHAHIQTKETLVALSGSFDVILDNGFEKKRYLLNKPSEGLLIPTGIWRELADFSAGAICMVVASERYNEDDYIRSYSDFVIRSKEDV